MAPVTIVLHRYWQPTPAWKPRGKRTLSVPMTAEQAAARGLVDFDPSTREERHPDGNTSAGMAHLGGRGPGVDWST